MTTTFDGDRNLAAIIQAIREKHGGRISAQDAIYAFGREATHSEWTAVAQKGIGDQVRGALRGDGYRKVPSADAYVREEQLSFAEFEELAREQAKRGSRFFVIVRDLADTCAAIHGEAFDPEQIIAEAVAA